MPTIIIDPQWLDAALLSALALYLGYRFLKTQLKEAPVPFHVPIPPEVRGTDWSGRNWEDIHGEGKKVLEGQVVGVSIPSFFWPEPLVLINVEFGCW